MASGATAPPAEGQGQILCPLRDRQVRRAIYAGGSFDARYGENHDRLRCGAGHVPARTKRYAHLSQWRLAVGPPSASIGTICSTASGSTGSSPTPCSGPSKLWPGGPIRYAERRPAAVSDWRALPAERDILGRPDLRPHITGEKANLWITRHHDRRLVPAWQAEHTTWPSRTTLEKPASSCLSTRSHFCARGSENLREGRSNALAEFCKNREGPGAGRPHRGRYVSTAATASMRCRRKRCASSPTPPAASRMTTRPRSWC